MSVAILNIDEVESGSDWALMNVSGEIDLDTVSKLRGQLDGAEGRGVYRLILDFSETSYVNSSALAVLVKFAERFREKGGGIGLVAVNQRVKLVFEMLGLLVFFKFFETIEAAKAAFPAEAQG
jgi:anti-anti-sigma factor